MIQHFLKLISDLLAAYKQGFRWRTIAQTVPMTPSDSVPLSMLPSTSRYVSVPSEPYTATGSGLNSETWTPTTAATPLPWATATAPALQPTIPRTYWRFDRQLDLRKGNNSLRRPETVSSTVPQSEPLRTTVPPPTPLPTRPTITVAPVTPVGVPGSSHDGVNKVNFDDTTNFLYFILVLGFGFKCRFDHNG